MSREIVIRGGLPGHLEDDIALLDGQQIVRDEGEAVEAFRQRVRDTATADRAQLVVFGGLPYD